MADFFKDNLVELESPAERAAAVTPNDSTDLANSSRALYIGTGGNVSIVTVGGDTVTFSNLADGSLLPVRAARVRLTDTTASDIVAVW